MAAKKQRVDVMLVARGLCETREQAKRLVGAMIDTLGPADRVEMIEFGWRPRRFRHWEPFLRFSPR